MKHVKVVGTAVGIFVGLSLSSQAVILLPGGSGLNPAQEPGPPPLARLSNGFILGDLNGVVFSWVVRDPANPLGGLSFYYQVVSGGQEPIGGFTASNFGIEPGAPIEVSTITAAFDVSFPGPLGIAPTIANRSGGAGNVVGIDFVGPGIGTAQWSEVLVVNTSFQSFGDVTGSVNNSVNVTLLGPVPEPSSVIAGSMLMVPLAFSALRILRKAS